MADDQTPPILPALTANERGADRGWPDASRPGVPVNPDQRGWHWLRHKRGDAISPWLWTDEGGEWDAFSWATDDEPYDSDAADRYFEYIGPCLTPAQHAAEIAAAVQVEREVLAQHADMLALSMHDDGGGEMQEFAAFIRARGTTEALDRTEAGVREVAKTALTVLCMCREVMRGSAHPNAMKDIDIAVAGLEAIIPTPASAETVT